MRIDQTRFPPDLTADRDAAGERALRLPLPTSSDRAFRVTVPRNGTSGSATMVAPGGCAYTLAIFGRPAGRLLARGDHFVFHAADPVFWNLEPCCFESVAEAERAVHTAWLRHQHRRRGRSGIRHQNL